MKLYSTLTKQIDEIKPLNPPIVTVYTCGPTVYDYAHIGHWFTYVRMDTLIRALKADGLQPKWVMNITDVGHLVSDADEGEDKLEKGAKREGKSAWEVAEFYTQDFIEGMKALNMLQPDKMVKATDHIPDQIELIKQLDDKGYAYIIDAGVYYDTSKFSRYGDFAGLDLDEQQAGARVSLNPQKRNASDFALWKFSPTDHKRDMEWDSPWGKGFPGWHIDCSAMSMKYLGPTLDIHTGGIDHVPVHHTNEIAQSEAATGKPFAQHWLHANHVMVEGQKISKSLSNGVSLQATSDKGYSAEVVRLHVLESHYRSQSRFSWDSLEAAQNRLNNLQAFADLRFQATASDGKASGADFDKYTELITNALLDDLNTPKALALLSGLVDEHSVISRDELGSFKRFITSVDELLGTKLGKSEDISADQRQLITKREAARAIQDWQVSDNVRDQLGIQGVGLRDTPGGAIWFRQAPQK
ncbi:MAG: cysteine--tRNA ligase [Patescibacteria group bacterium]